MMDKVGEMDAATLPDLDQLDSKALKSLILELHMRNLGVRAGALQSDSAGSPEASLWGLRIEQLLRGHLQFVNQFKAPCPVHWGIALDIRTQRRIRLVHSGFCLFYLWR
jgi:hypothetical protein